MLNMRKQLQILAILPIPFLSLAAPISEGNTVASHEMSLEDRQADTWVNGVFADNILLNLAYLRGVNPSRNVDWNEVKKPFEFEFSLDPNQVFAFHEDVLEKYEGKIAKTTNAHFNFSEGFKSDGYLVGDGVCHLASLLYWVAKDAGLEADAPTNHDFMSIPDIDKKYGVSIFNMPGSKSSNARQNLYITNNKDRPVTFKFAYKDNKLQVDVIESD